MCFCYAQVKMNAETNKIKDIYLEVLKPVVDKLYNMKVFYSREVARVISSTLIFFMLYFFMRFFMYFMFVLLRSLNCSS